MNIHFERAINTLRTAILLMLSMLVCGGNAFADGKATLSEVTFALSTTDADGNPITQTRHYMLYRPANLPLTTPVPMVLVMECRGGDYPATFFNAAADQAGFVVVSCAIQGNSTTTAANPLGTVWNDGDPKTNGLEDLDYASAVIQRVRQSDNCSDAFMCGVSKGGHMSYAYACARPSMLKAVCSVDEFMGVTTNIPTMPLPVMAIHGTKDTAVPYAMGKDSVDTWRRIDRLLSETPVTTYEASPLLPGRVTEATWSGGSGGSCVSFVTIVGGGHIWPQKGTQSGYSSPHGIWAFFSQFLTGTQPSPKIVSLPMNNVQYSGQQASFHSASTGDMPLRYQWQKNGVNIPRATSNVYTTPPITVAENGATYRVVVSNRSGSVTSDPATLTVVPAPSDPTITVQPVSQARRAGQPVTFSVEAKGAGTLKYQWMKNGMAITGATEPSCTLPVTLTPDCGAAFSVAVSNESGSVASAPATLTVTPAPGAPVITTAPARVRATQGQPATFSVTAASSAPMSYQWQRGTLTTNFVDIPGATADKYTISATTMADSRTLFRCIVSNRAGSTASTAEMVLVRVSTTY